MPTIHYNYAIKHLNSFGIDVNAKLFTEVRTEEELKTLFSSAVVKENQLLVLGGGSNMLFTKDYEGLIIKVSIKGIDVKDDEHHVYVTAGAGEVWHDFVKYCVAKQYCGLENLTLIPGTVGASPVQNIGAYGVEIKDVFESCVAFDTQTNQLVTFSNKDCEFAYRDSLFKSKAKGRFIITHVTFKLAKTPTLKIHYGVIKEELAAEGILAPSIRDVSDVVAKIRVNKLPEPKTIGNAGSFFKNPVVSQSVFNKLKEKFDDIANYPLADGSVKLAAGWLIEKCGFKGVVDGNTGTWKNQALVLVNYGEATGLEVYNFSEKVINTVQNTFGVTLEREVNIF